MSVFLRSSALTAHTIRSSLALPAKTHLRSTPVSFAATNKFYSFRTFQNSAVNMGVHTVASKAEFNSALKDNNVVVLDAFATWCGPCKVMAPTLDKFSEEFPSAHFVKVDIDEVPDVAQELSVHSVPLFVIFKGEEKVAEVLGAKPKELRDAIESALSQK